MVWSDFNRNGYMNWFAAGACFVACLVAIGDINVFLALVFFAGLLFNLSFGVMLGGKK